MNRRSSAKFGRRAVLLAGMAVALTGLGAGQEPSPAPPPDEFTAGREW
jgi:hypothetical protein